MFAALNGAHNQTLVSAALERFDRRKIRVCGLSCAPKWRAFHMSFVMQVPRPDFEWHEMREMCR